MTTPTDVTFVDNTTPVISAAWLNGVNDWVYPAYNAGTFVFNGATVTFAGTNGTTITFPSITTALPGKATTNVFTKTQSVTPVALSLSGTNLDTDASLSNVFTYTTGATDFTLTAPTNLVAGTDYIWHFTQGATARVITFNASFLFPSGIDGVLTASASAKDTLVCSYDGTSLRCVMLNGFA